MSKTPVQLDQQALYEAALEGLELQKQRIEEQIAAVRSLLGGKKAAAPAPASAAAPAKKKANKAARKRVLSAEARERIAAAQKKRWAAFRKDKS